MSHESHSHGGMDDHSTAATHTTRAMHGGHLTDKQAEMTHDNHGTAAIHAMMFHLGRDLRLLFEPWEISSIKVLVGSCIAVFVLSVLYEGLKILRAKLIQHTATRRAQNSGGSTSKFYISGPQRKFGLRMFSLAHFFQTLLHVLQLLLGYLLMLVVMTYQVYLGLAVVIGGGLGYFLFASFVSTHPHRECMPSSRVYHNSAPESPAIVLKTLEINGNQTGNGINVLGFPQEDHNMAKGNKSFEN